MLDQASYVYMDQASYVYMDQAAQRDIERTRGAAAQEDSIEDLVNDIYEIEFMDVQG
jgi:hypothetical protein